MCPVRGEPMGSPVDASHSRTLLSLMYPSPLHDAMTLPFGEKTTQLTRSEWPFTGHCGSALYSGYLSSGRLCWHVHSGLSSECPLIGSPVVASHTLTVLSSLHETSFLPVGSKPTQLTSLPIAEK